MGYGKVLLACLLSTKALVKFWYRVLFVECIVFSMKSGQENFNAHGNTTLKVTEVDNNVAAFSGTAELSRLGFSPHTPNDFQETLLSYFHTSKYHQRLIIHFIEFIKAHFICRFSLQFVTLSI